MDSDRFNYRGLKIGFAGVALMLLAIQFVSTGWLLVLLALAGLGIGFVGCAVHFMDMVRQHQVRVEERQAWVRQHGDPDLRDDPRVK
jgi:hypothetical protein